MAQVLNILEEWLLGRGWGYERIDGSVGMSQSLTLVFSCGNMHWLELDCKLETSTKVAQCCA